MAPAIVADHVTKTYRHYGAHRPRALKEAVLRGFRSFRPERLLPALDDVSFRVEQGRTLGIIGPNGAGKSTLLRLVGGVGRPDHGSLDVSGRIGALLDLGAGFHPDLTGRESAVLAGVIAGLSRRAVRKRLDSIAAFAELEDVLDDPVRTYSSGMQARLGFSVAIHVDPDVLLIDEVLAVGDLAFQERCIERLERLQMDGTAMMVVSHDPGLLARMCDEVLWLRGGRTVALGDPASVTEQYVSAMAEQTRRSTPDDLSDEVTPGGVVLEPHVNRWGSQKARIARALILDATGEACDQIMTGGSVRLLVEVAAGPHLGPVQVSATLIRRDGVACIDACTTVTTADDGIGLVRLDLGRVDLGGDDYAFDLGVYREDWEETFDYHHAAYPLKVVGPSAGSGLMAPPLAWTQEELVR